MTITNQFTCSALLFLLTGLSLFAPPVTAYSDAQASVINLSPMVSHADCIDFINERVDGTTCHWIELPLDHSAPESGRTIQIPMLVARAAKQNRTREQTAVLIPGGGGPGAPIGFGYLYEPGEFLQPFQSLLQAGLDVVILDQRGAGLSHPRLSCAETPTLFEQVALGNLDLNETLAAQRSATQSCVTRFRDTRVDPQFFDTWQSAKDFLVAIDTVTERKWHVLATSYATVIAQVMLQIDPTIFNKVVLDSPVPVNFQQPLSNTSLIAAIKKTITACGNQSDCQNRYPSLAEQFNHLLKRAKRKPYKLKIKIVDNDGRNRRKTLVVDRELLISIFFTALYNSEHTAKLPKIIYRIYNGEIQALHNFAVDFWYQNTDLDYADGLFASVHCRERQQLENNYTAQHTNFWTSLDATSRRYLANQKALCRIWNVGEQRPTKTTPLISAQTLILAGQLDPVISAQDIASTAALFSHKHVVLEPTASHSVWYQSRCYREMVKTYFLDVKTLSQMRQCGRKSVQFELQIR